MAAAFHAVVAVLVAAGWATGAVGGSISVVLATVWILGAVAIGVGWRNTGRTLTIAMAIFALWAVLVLLGR